jgi:hypothetical protein
MKELDKSRTPREKDVFLRAKIIVQTNTQIHALISFKYRDLAG